MTAIMLCTIPLLFGTVGTTEVIIIAIVILLLFGGKKIPELMKGLGKGIRSFKQGMNEVTDEINKSAEDERPQANEDSERKKQ